jgi:WD40 repeat protein
MTTSPHPAKLSSFAAHADSVQAVSFSPDGHLLATAAIDHTARLWDIGDPRSPVQLANFAGHSDSVWSVAFTPDGHRLATGSADHSVRFWLTSAEDAARLICSTSGPELTPEQWDHYASGAPYRHVCG